LKKENNIRLAGTPPDSTTYSTVSPHEYYAMGGGIPAPQPVLVPDGTTGGLQMREGEISIVATGLACGTGILKLLSEVCFRGSIPFARFRASRAAGCM
jgi:hypothetical protein